MGSDGSWKAATGPILMSEIYHGETYDARLEKPGWTRPASTTGTGRRSRSPTTARTTSSRPTGPPVERIEELRPVKVFKTPAGDTVVDMGQNMVGWVRLKVEGPAGTTVTLRHAEVLDKAGNLYTENLREAKADGALHAQGRRPRDLRAALHLPRLPLRGGRRLPGRADADSLTGVVIHSDMAPSGEFETSSPLLNQLQHNILWGQKGNFLDVPTDCPQRDERLGWTGDAQVFARTAAFNMDVAAFFTKWLQDVAADQFENGSVPHVIPDVLTRAGQRCGRRRRLGRRRGDHPLDDVPELRRQADPRRAVRRA